MVAPLCRWVWVALCCFVDWAWRRAWCPRHSRLRCRPTSLRGRVRRDSGTLARLPAVRKSFRARDSRNGVWSASHAGNVEPRFGEDVALVSRPGRRPSLQEPPRVDRDDFTSDGSWRQKRPDVGQLISWRRSLEVCPNCPGGAGATRRAGWRVCSPGFGGLCGTRAGTCSRPRWSDPASAGAFGAVPRWLPQCQRRAQLLVCRRADGCAPVVAVARHCRVQVAGRAPLDS